MKINKIFIFIILIASCWHSMGQPFQFQPEKPGKFILQNKLNKCPGIDVVAITNKLTAIAEWVRQNNTVVNSPKGFDALISMSGNFCDKRTKIDDYGIQSSIYFSFHHFWIENGVPGRATGNTAHGTEILINNPKSYICTQFTESEFITDDPSHMKQPLEKALETLQKYYTIAPVLKEIAPGVKVYAPGSGWFKGILLVFNPDLPDIWIPVTVREIMEAKLEYYRVKQEIDSINYEKTLAAWAKLNFKPDQVMRPNLYDVINKEFENFTSEELILPAYSCASEECGISTINVRGEGRQVVKFNPACWDRSLPVTAVQYISLEYRPATETELEEFKPRNGGLADYVGLFYVNLLVEKMSVLIQRK